MRIPHLEKALISLENVNDIETVLDEYCMKIESEFSLAKHLPQINKCFNASTIEEILRNLEMDGTEWARQTIAVSSKYQWKTQERKKKSKSYK